MDIFVHYCKKNCDFWTFLEIFWCTFQLKCPKISKNVQKSQKKIQKCTKTSKNVTNCLNTSGTRGWSRFAPNAVALPSALPWQKSALVLVDFLKVLFYLQKQKYAFFSLKNQDLHLKHCIFCELCDFDFFKTIWEAEWKF